MGNSKRPFLFRAPSFSSVVSMKMHKFLSPSSQLWFKGYEKYFHIWAVMELNYLCLLCSFLHGSNSRSCAYPSYYGTICTKRSCWTLGQTLGVFGPTTCSGKSSRATQRRVSLDLNFDTLQVNRRGNLLVESSPKNAQSSGIRALNIYGICQFLLFALQQF